MVHDAATSTDTDAAGTAVDNPKAGAVVLDLVPALVVDERLS